LLLLPLPLLLLLLLLLLLSAAAHRTRQLWAQGHLRPCRRLCLGRRSRRLGLDRRSRLARRARQLRPNWDAVLSCHSFPLVVGHPCRCRRCRIQCVSLFLR
jgi:hypothetical protein